MTDSSPVDLTNCDREPIHVPGSIQPHGCLIACDPEAVILRRHSVNLHAMLELGEETVTGRRLETVLAPQLVHNLRNALARSGEPSRPGLMTGVQLSENGPLFDLSVHRHGGNAIIEIEPTAPEGTTSPLEFTRTLIRRLERFGSIDRLVRQAARLLRAVLQYDRVMIYRFAPDGSGQVISEAKRPDLESFLGQHFPAGDIPQQARRLYLQNPIRIVSDASGARVAIAPERDEAGQPLDLSFAHLRSVSPIHCEYLRNMGVGASMSISVIIGGQLWGLIACHHYAPRTLPMNLRIAAEIFGEFFSLQLDALIQREKLDAAERARGFLDDLLQMGPQSGDVSGFLRERLPDFHRLLVCDGIGLWLDGTWAATGSTPPQTAIPTLLDFLNEVAEGRVFACHDLPGRCLGADAYRAEAAGVLCVPLSQRPRDYLLFFRREVIETVEWGGDPNKQYEIGPLGDRLTPRKSFAIWKETVERQSKPWSDSDLRAAESTRSALVEVVLHHTELLAEEKRKADQRQKLLNEELNHRVKNILALITSLVSRPVENDQPIIDYVESLKGRIAALSVAHDQAVRGNGGGALSALLEAELAPYRGNATIALDGPPVRFDARAHSVLALVLHELATNAAKYGALSRASGRLAISWRREEDDGLALLWAESGGPPVVAPKRTGFGSVLIDRGIPFDLGGRAEIDYAVDGLRADIAIPAPHLDWTATDAATVAPASASRPAAPVEVAAPLSGAQLLVVEDQFLIAMEVEAVLTEAGAGRVEICATLDEAFARLGQFRPDAAILDVQLGSGTSAPLARQLVEAGIPFAFASGFSDSGLPADLPPAPLIRKPYGAPALVGAVVALLAGKPASP
jgi:light-regulated signal transduction histidine kinase (bacteriophytochrome)/CheY-like chemotaxis protein